MNKDTKDLKHINFRVTVPEESYPAIFNTDFWPRGVRLKEYIYRHRLQSNKHEDTPVF